MVPTAKPGSARCFVTLSQRREECSASGSATPPSMHRPPVVQQHMTLAHLDDFFKRTGVTFTGADLRDTAKMMSMMGPAAYEPMG